MTGRPASSEHVPYHGKYIALVPGEDVLAAFENQSAATRTFLASISSDKSLHRYDPAKWSVREAWVHVLDCERVFVYRALRLARGDTAALEGFEPDRWGPPSGADARSWRSILLEYEDVRRATIAFFRNLPEDAWLRTGKVGGNFVSVRALAWIAVGHDIHHRTVIRDLYLGAGPTV